MSKRPNCVATAPKNKRGGEWAAYPDSWYTDMVDFEPFTTTMFFTGYSRGRSAARICVKSDCGDHAGEIFMTDFESIMLEHGWPIDGVTGTWGICKRGMNYGLFLMPHGGAE